MGQILNRFQTLETDISEGRKNEAIACFRDLNELPPELALLILANLNATDLCLASCVWGNLASDEILWQKLCLKQWGYVSIYKRVRAARISYKDLYMRLDEASLTFNADPDRGMNQFFSDGLLLDSAEEIAKFIHYARNLHGDQRQKYLDGRRDVLDHLVRLQRFEKQFLPNALRKFFQETRPPNDRGSYLQDLVEKFSSQFCECNPELGLNSDSTYVLCFSLILLSVDLCSPHIKNKMSKREFIRNTRQAAQGVNDDFAGHLYDNIYLVGHVAPFEA